MKSRMVFIAAIGLAALLAWSPVAAQDEGLSEEDLALVEFVASAIDNLNTQDSYRIHSKQWQPWLD